MEDCIVYLVWQLRQAAFEVRFTWPAMLYISWKHHEGDYLARQNPIVQAMIPETNKNNKNLPKTSGGSQKKKNLPAHSFNHEIELITSGATTSGGPNPGTGYGYGSSPGSAFGSTPVNPQPRRGADYEPPPSFLQNLDRPGPDRVIKMPGAYKEGAKGNVLADLWS